MSSDDVMEEVRERLRMVEGLKAAMEEAVRLGMPTDEVMMVWLGVKGFEVVEKVPNDPHPNEPDDEPTDDDEREEGK